MQLQRHLDDGIPLPDATPTVSQLFNSWYDDVLRRQVAPSASSNYERIFDHHIIPTLGRKLFAKRSDADVDLLISEKLDSGLSVSTVQRIHFGFAQAIDKGIRCGSVPRNVARLSRAPKSVRTEGRTLTPENCSACRVLSAAQICPTSCSGAAEKPLPAQSSSRSRTSEHRWVPPPPLARS